MDSVPANQEHLWMVVYIQATLHKKGTALVRVSIILLGDRNGDASCRKEGGKGVAFAMPC